MYQAVLYIYLGQAMYQAVLYIYLGQAMYQAVLYIFLGPIQEPSSTSIYKFGLSVCLFVCIQ